VRWALGLGVVVVVAAIVFLWPGPRRGPEPIAWGRDACAACRMVISRPGFAGEMRDADGRLTRYDDVGCLLRAVTGAHREVPEAWVEDHGGGGWMPLLRAHLVRAEHADTPMGYGLVAFADAAAARAFAERSGGDVVALEEVLREPGRLAGAGRIP
jgi:copper chaperone NosL